MDEHLLEVSSLTTGYGGKEVLTGVSLHVQYGEIVGIIGPNGSGKSTLLRAICGLLPAWRGYIRFQETNVGASTMCNSMGGIAFAPQGNRTFDELTVAEHLELGGFCLPAKKAGSRIAEVLRVFPALAERPSAVAGKLSGGEQQMLSVARALVAEPRLLLLDEPSVGLAPGLVDDVFRKLLEINRETGTAMLIVEQRVREVLEHCGRVYLLRLGRVAFAGESSVLRDDDERLKRLFL